MDYILYILTVCLFGSLAVMSGLTAYFFYLSKNGNLRKILVRKFTALCLLFNVIAFVWPQGTPSWQKIIVIIIISVAAYFMLILQRYLIKNRGNGV